MSSRSARGNAAGALSHDKARRLRHGENEGTREGHKGAPRDTASSRPRARLCPRDLTVTHCPFFQRDAIQPVPLNRDAEHRPGNCELSGEHDGTRKGHKQALRPRTHFCPEPSLMSSGPRPIDHHSPGQPIGGREPSILVLTTKIDKPCSGGVADDGPLGTEVVEVALTRRGMCGERQTQRVDVFDRWRVVPGAYLPRGPGDAWVV